MRKSIAIGLSQRQWITYKFQNKLINISALFLRDTMARAITLLIFFTACLPHLFAQKGFVLLLNDSLPKEITFEKKLADKAGAEMQAGKIITQLMNLGFLTASSDEISLNEDTAFVKIYKGNRFDWGQINYKYLPKPMIKQFGFDQATKGLARVEELKQAMTHTINYFENRGYPFAYFYWDSLVIKNDTIAGSLYFEKNILITFDTIALYGDAGVTKNFLYNYLGFKPGQPFNETVIAELNNKLSKLPFTNISARPQLFFVGRKAIILLNLKKRKTDRLDGLVGFAPNTGTPGNTKLLVTGEFHLDFKNMKGTGKGFKVDWQSFKARSQTLNMSASLPYLFNQPIGAELGVDFLKYDTIYTETRFNIGTQYIFSGLDNIKIFYEQKNTNLQSVDTNLIRQSGKLGNLTAMKTNRYGMAINWVTLNNRISPTKGFIIDATASIYKRQIKKDLRIEKVRFFNSASSSYFNVYDSTQLTSYQLLFQYTLAKPFLLSKNLVIYNELVGYHFVSPSVYFNELYRFGGNKTLKGFNEQSLFASSVSIITAELRYLLSENSFLKLFGNAAYYNDQSERFGKINSDIPFGFGGGLNLDTGKGIFNISVALGKSKYNPIDFKNTKVHFGLINYF